MKQQQNNSEKIFKALRNDHSVQRELMTKLLKTEGDSPERRTIFEKLKNELEEHAKYEERYFYKYLMDKDITQDLSRHSIAEHKKIDDYIEALDDMDFSSPGWLVKAKEFGEYVEHHLSEEEHEFFQLAGRALTEKQKVELAEKYNEHMH